MAKAFQAGVGAENLDVRNESFDAIVAGTVTDYDIVLSQVTINDERKQVVDFTIPYFESQQGVLAKAGAKITTLEEAKKTKWGVQTGTTAIALLEDLVKPTASQPSTSRSPTPTPPSTPARSTPCSSTPPSTSARPPPPTASSRWSRSSSSRAGPTSTARSCRRARPTWRSSTQILAAMEAAGLLDQFADGEPQQGAIRHPGDRCHVMSRAR